MKHTIPAALRVAARPRRANEIPGEAPCPTDRPGFAPTDRWALLDLVAELRRSLRLTTNDIAVLRALLSFLPVRLSAGREGPVTPDTLTVVFASNAAIAQRAGGMDERVLRHAFRRLASAGLLARRDSASGKRFPIRRGGRIVSAYGLDLAPGFVLTPELLRRAQTQRDAAEIVRARRAELFARRRHLLDRARDLCAAAKAWLESLSTVLRRKLSPDDLDILSADLSRIEADMALEDDPGQTSMTVDNTVVETPETSGTDGRIYRHKESEKIDKQKKGSSPVTGWKGWPEVQSLFPSPPRTLEELREILCQLAAMLRIRPEALRRAVSRLGWVGVGDAMNAICARVTEIRNPTSYLLALVEDGRDTKTEGSPAVSWNAC